MKDPAAWLLVGASIAVFALYELVAWKRGRAHPERLARYAHARMRVDWTNALNDRPGFEIVAVQSLRNSLMSATIVASTAALALMGSVTLAGTAVEDVFQHLGTQGLGVRPMLEGLLVIALFASYVCSSNAMRYFNHACFVMSMPAGSEERAHWAPLASDYVERAGILYSWGLRTFLFVAPLVAGIVHPYTMPPMTLLLLVVQSWFDRPAQLRSPLVRTRATDRAPGEGARRPSPPGASSEPS